MEFKSIVFLGLMSYSTIAAADKSYPCENNPDHNLSVGHPYAHLTITTNDEGVASSTRKLDSPNIIICKHAGPNAPVLLEHIRHQWGLFYFNKSTNIDFSRPSVTVENGMRYYKLTGTHSDFVNKYGYIHFRVANDQGNNAYRIRSYNVPLISGNGGLSQGVQVDDMSIRFFTDKGIPLAGPVEKQETVKIDLGQFSLSLTELDSKSPKGTHRLTGAQHVYVTVTIQPTLISGKLPDS